MTNRYRHIFVLLSQLVLTVPNSANFRKGGDHLRIKDNTQTRTDNHTQKIRKEGFKRMNVKKKARRVMSGLLTAVTVLSTVLSPAVAYAEVSTMECHKLNRAYTGLMVRKEGEMLTPTINLNQLYEAYKAQPGVTMETVCRKIADIVIEAPIQVDLKAILNYEDVKDKLFIRVSSAEANKEVLEIVPHQLKEDLAITYHVAVGKNQDGLSSMLITNEMMKEYGVTQEQIHEDAMKSSPRVMVPEVSSIGVLIDEIYQKNILMLTPDEREMLLETLQESSEMPTFFVVTNTERIDGAGVIFYPEFMDNMGELLGNDFFILPSSIHQMLILPDDGQVDAEMLRDMVKEVNATQVAPAERLTNDVYHFDTKDHVFEKADRFTERQKEKEAQVAKTEKVGKEQPDQKPKTKKHDMEL